MLMTLMKQKVAPTRSLLLAGLLLVFCLLFGPQPAESRGSPNNPQLATLLDKLALAESPETADRLTRAIWQIWTNDTPNPAFRMMMEQGMSMMSNGQLDMADKIFTSLIRLDPDYTEAWNKRATTRYMLGWLEGSERDIAEVLEREPRHFGALSGLAIIRLQQGELEEALQTFLLIRQIHPFSKDAEIHIPQLQKALRGKAV